MAARNDVTGDVIATKGTSDAYRNNFDAIFRKKTPEPVVVKEEPVPTAQEQAEDPAVAAKKLRDEHTAAWWKYVEQNQKTLTSIPSFEEFRTTILPTLAKAEEQSPAKQEYY